MAVALAPEHLDWLYRLGAQALADRRRVSHSEVVRLAVDRMRARAVDEVAGELQREPAGEGRSASYALTGDQVKWLRDMTAHAQLSAGITVSLADVVRAAVAALTTASWRELRDDLDIRIRKPGRAAMEETA